MTRLDHQQDTAGRPHSAGRQFNTRRYVSINIYSILMEHEKSAVKSKLPRH